MNIKLVKATFYLIGMSGLLIMAFMTQNVATSKVLASLGILTGVLASRNLSIQTDKK